MSRRVELNPDYNSDERALRERGYARCEHCLHTYPVPAGRCRRRTCPGYSGLWARDTMRKIRTNLEEYGGLAVMLSLTAPGEDMGLVWDRTVCTHSRSEKCSGPKGCRVDSRAAEIWNVYSRSGWSELNRICKQRADRVLKRLGHDGKGGVLLYEWELQDRGVWHLHFVLGMETAVERVWAFEYSKAMRLLGPAKGFGFIDLHPLRNPQPATKVGSYLAKYLAKWRADGTLEVSETVKSAGRTLVNYVSRRLTRSSGCTMRSLRMLRVAWAFREGLIPQPTSDPFELLLALCRLEQNEIAARGP